MLLGDTVAFALQPFLLSIALSLHRQSLRLCVLQDVLNGLGGIANIGILLPDRLAFRIGSRVNTEYRRSIRSNALRELFQLIELRGIIKPLETSRQE